MNSATGLPGTAMICFSNVTRSSLRSMASPDSSLAVTLPQDCRHVGDFRSGAVRARGSCLQALNAAKEVGLYKVGVQAAGLDALHRFADAADFGGIHGSWASARSR